MPANIACSVVGSPAKSEIDADSLEFLFSVPCVFAMLCNEHFGGCCGEKLSVDDSVGMDSSSTLLHLESATAMETTVSMLVPESLPDNQGRGSDQWNKTLFLHAINSFEPAGTKY